MKFLILFAFVLTLGCAADDSVTALENRINLLEQRVVVLESQGADQASLQERDKLNELAALKSERDDMLGRYTSNNPKLVAIEAKIAKLEKTIQIMPLEEELVRLKNLRAKYEVTYTESNPKLIKIDEDIKRLNSRLGTLQDS